MCFNIGGVDGLLWCKINTLLAISCYSSEWPCGQFSGTLGNHVDSVKTNTLIYLIGGKKVQSQY